MKETILRELATQVVAFYRELLPALMTALHGIIHMLTKGGMQ